MVRGLTAPNKNDDLRSLQNQVDDLRDTVRFTGFTRNQSDATGFGMGGSTPSTPSVRGLFALDVQQTIESIFLSWTGATGELKIGDEVSSSTTAWKGTFLGFVSEESETAGRGIFEPTESGTPDFTEGVQNLTTTEGWSAAYDTGTVATEVLPLKTSSALLLTIDDVDPTIKWIAGTLNNGQFITVKPINTKTLTLTSGGNIDISSDVTVSDNEVAILQFHRNDINANSEGSYSVGSVSGGGTTSINSIKKQVRFATTGNNLFHPDYNMIIDGATEGVEGDRVLIKSQTDQEDNGIYVIGTVSGSSPNATATLTRATDFDNDSDVKASVLVAVEEGTANENSLWLLTTDNPIIVGTTELIFSEFTGSGDNLGNHIATEALKMKDFKVFLNTDEDQWIVGTAGGIGTVAPAGDTIDWFINSALTPIFGITETDFNTNVPIKTFGVDTNSFMSFFRDYDVDSPAVDDLLGVITFEGHDNALNAEQFANIGVFTENVTNGSEAARLSIQVAENGATSLNAWTYRSDSVTHTNQLQVGTTDPLEYIFYRDDFGGATDGDELGQITFDGNNDDPVRATYAEITGISQNVIDTIEQGNLRFKVRNSGPLTTSYEIKGGAGFPAGKPLHEFTGSIEVNNLLGGSNIELGTTHATDPDNVFNFNLGSGASAEVDIFTNIKDIIFRTEVFAGERMRIKSSGTLPTTETTTSWTSYENPANLELYNDGQGNVANDDVLGTIKFYGDTSGSGAQSRVEYGSIRVEAIDSTEPASGGIMKFNIRQQDSLITYLRIDGDGVAPDSTLGVLVSEKPFKMQTIYPNTAADIGYSNATWINSFIDEMHCDRILFDETESPTRADTSMGADALEVWINHDALAGAFNIRWNDQVSVSEIRHQFTFSDYISKNGGNDHVIRNNIESMLFSQSNGDHWIFAGNNHTRFELIGDGFTVAGLNDDEILFDSSNSTANDIVGQIHFTGVTDTAAEFDIAKIVAKNQVPTNASRSGLLEFKLSQSGSENTTFMIMDGFFDKIETFATFDIGSHYIEMDSISAPTHSTATKRFLFADSGNSNHLSVRTDSTVIDLEAGGGGGEVFTWTADHNANTFDLLNMDRLFFTLSSGGFASSSDTGIVFTANGLQQNVATTKRHDWTIDDTILMTLREVGAPLNTLFDLQSDTGIVEFNVFHDHIANDGSNIFEFSVFSDNLATSTIEYHRFDVENEQNNTGDEACSLHWYVRDVGIPQYMAMNQNRDGKVSFYQNVIMASGNDIELNGNDILMNGGDIILESSGNAFIVGDGAGVDIHADGTGDSVAMHVDGVVHSFNATGLSLGATGGGDMSFRALQFTQTTATFLLDGAMYYDDIANQFKVRENGVIKTITGGSGTSFIGFTADDELDMNNFDIVNIDDMIFNGTNSIITAIDFITMLGPNSQISMQGGDIATVLNLTMSGSSALINVNQGHIENVDHIDFNSAGSFIQQLDDLTMLDSGSLINMSNGAIALLDTLSFNGSGSALNSLDNLSMLDSGAVINMASGRINNLENVSGTPTFSGDVFFNEDVTLGNSSTDNIIFNGDVVNSITPNTSALYSLGSSTLRWNVVYIDTAADILELPAGNQPAIGTNRMALFCRPDGAGKTEFRVRFQTGATQQIAIEV